MGRHFPTGASTQALASALPLLPGQLPSFGAGRFAVIYDTRDFIPPAGVGLVRVRVFGGGGGRTLAGGTSSFGTHLSASGGQPGASGVNGAGGAGGTGVGGQYQSPGGSGGLGEGAGGGASGSELGPGGAGGTAWSDAGGGGGGAVGGISGGNGTAFNSGFGASPFGPAPGANGKFYDYLGHTSHGVVNPIAAVLPFPGYAFMGSGSDAQLGGASGPGAGGGGGYHGQGQTRGGSPGGTFGGGGGAAVPAASAALGGRGGTWIQQVFFHVGQLEFPGGAYNRFIGGGHGGAKGRSGSGGGGYARGVVQVAAGTPIACTVAAQNDADGSSGGLIIVEW